MVMDSERQGLVTQFKTQYEMINTDEKSYKELGYVLLRNFLDKDLIDGIREEAKLIFVNQFKALGLVRTEKISNEEFEVVIVKLFNSNFEVFSNCGKQIQHLISLHQLSLSDQIILKLKELGINFPVISTRPVLYFNKAKLAKSEEFYKVPAHQDWRSMQGSLNSMVVWIPLADVPEELGALTIVPESHKMGLLESTENPWFRQIKEVLPGDFKSVEVKAGDALFFSSFLVHASGNNVLDKIRWSTHFRYNDLNENSFIERGYPHPYIYKPVQELITPNFPLITDIEKIF